MVEFTADERQQIALAMMDETPIEAKPLTDVKSVFCQNWDTVKQVLEFLSGYLPLPVRFAVKALIKAGDILHGKIC
ncbi:hypothetical protein J2Y58_002190 [Sphingomonas sp. BE138]|uniref:hypothetical protein n=1 Tax=Sphingomonas sp. BE138 TaxID=2817845 RepID=UPI00285698FB|nr:hypothetical protein [Sphingomonas sp. BE138]MDR6788825.1 hypothetical protein [Sphingomonas sp. BE138]